MFMARRRSVLRRATERKAPRPPHPTTGRRARLDVFSHFLDPAGVVPAAVRDALEDGDNELPMTLRHSLAEQIEDRQNNTTRFLIMAREPDYARLQQRYANPEQPGP